MENLINNLNIYLSDLNVFYRKLQNYHWNIKGKSFFVVPAKLEEYYNEIKDYLNTTKITEAKNEKVTCEVVFSEIVKDYSELLQDSKNIKVLADENNEYKTSALMDDIIEDYSKKIWMIKQSME